ncbi:arogenate dehydratase/prephenate dehydratase 6, chloroplastic-like isoform X2 [Canna indica]|uniref:arogenate dehydratase n=1 Tax=Canna indica TaxID=4628 RepID=A0AAQ3KY49_9LILI|nr:arogenate dehydratase/prephenate dehydratase 6, chloroplastic-like isoform X2 [Canna indica]
MALKAGMWSGGAAHHLGGAAHLLGLQAIDNWRRVTPKVSMSDWRLERAKGRRSDLSDSRSRMKKDENSSFVMPTSSFLPSDFAEFKSCNPYTKPLSLTDLPVSGHGCNLRIAYQGCPGAFSEAAALKEYPHCEAVPCEHFDVAFKAVELWLVDKAILPIENSSYGSYHRNYDLLLQHRLHIVSEVQLQVDHCLMALPGVRKKELKRVLSHPQALGQCEIALNKLGVIKESFDDTAGAAQLIASKGLKDVGAIASAKAAEIYGLHILENQLQDVSVNITRFLILAREPVLPMTDRPFKTSIVFILEDGAGVLFKALTVFALRNIDILKIESRPHRKQPIRFVDDSYYGTAKYFHYLFYIDFEASLAEPRAQNALSNLQEFVSFLRVLGSYPIDTSL